MNKTGPLVIVSIRPQWPAGATGGTGFGRGVRLDFCGSTGFGWRSMYVFMVSVFLMSGVWGVSPTTCGSAPFTRCNPRLLRRADTCFTFIASHTV
jgi:hypothetical protein